MTGDSDHSPLCSCGTGSVLAAAAVSLPCNRADSIPLLALMLAHTVTYAFSEPRLLKAILAMVQAEEVHPCCYSSRDCLAAMQNHWGHTSMGLLTSPRAGWCASRSLSSCGGGALVSSGLSVGYWVVNFLDKGLGPEEAALCRPLSKPGNLFREARVLNLLPFLHQLPVGLINLS